MPVPRRALAPALVTACGLLLAAATAGARAPARVHLASLDLDVSVWERGVGMVHSAEHDLRFELSLRPRRSGLVVTGTSTYRTASLGPDGPSDGTEHTSRIDETFAVARTRAAGGWDITLTRVGDAAIAPTTIAWRCEQGIAGLPAGSLRCQGTEPLDAMPWNNGHWSQVPIVLGRAMVRNSVAWDGESVPVGHVSVAP